MERLHVKGGKDNKGRNWIRELLGTIGMGSNPSNSKENREDIKVLLKCILITVLRQAKKCIPSLPVTFPMNAGCGLGYLAFGFKSRRMAGLSFDH